MNKSKKVILGIFTFLPFVFLGLYLYNFFLFFKEFFSFIHQESAPDPGQMAMNFLFMFFMIFVVIVSGLAITIYYVIHTNKRTDLDGNKKLIWTLLLLLTSGLATVAYYFVEIIPMPTKTGNPLNNSA